MPKIQKENCENRQNHGNKKKKQRTPLIDKTNSFGNVLASATKTNKKTPKVKASEKKTGKSNKEILNVDEEPTIYDTVKRRQLSKVQNMEEKNSTVKQLFKDATKKEPKTKTDNSIKDILNVDEEPTIYDTVKRRQLSKVQNKEAKDSSVKQLFKDVPKKEPGVKDVSKANIKSPLSDKLTDNEILKMLESDVVLPTPPKILGRKDMNKRTMLNCLLKKNMESTQNSIVKDNKTPTTKKKTKKKVEIKATPNKSAKENRNPEISTVKTVEGSKKDQLPVYLQPRESSNLPKTDRNRTSECMRQYDFPDINDSEKPTKRRKAIKKIIRKRKPVNKPQIKNLEPLNEDLIFGHGPKASLSNFCPSINPSEHVYEENIEPEIPKENSMDFDDFDEVITNANLDTPARTKETWRVDLPVVLRSQLFETKKGSIVPNFSENNLDLSVCNSKLMHSLIHNTSHNVTDETLATNKSTKQLTLDSYLHSRNSHNNPIDFHNVVTSSPSAKRALANIDTNRMSPSLFGFDDDSDDQQIEVEQRKSKKPTRISLPRPQPGKRLPEVPIEDVQEVPQETFTEPSKWYESDPETQTRTEIDVDNEDLLGNEDEENSFSLFSGDIMPRRSYARTKKRKRLVSVCSEESNDEAEVTQIQKKKKNRRPKPEDKAAEEWAKSFNQMCQEVDEFPLVVE